MTYFHMGLTASHKPLQVQFRILGEEYAADKR